MNTAQEFKALSKITRFCKQGSCTTAPLAQVTYWGDLSIKADVVSPEEALRLAAWIVSTFGEGETK